MPRKNNNKRGIPWPNYVYHIHLVTMHIVHHSRYTRYYPTRHYPSLESTASHTGITRKVKNTREQIRHATLASITCSITLRRDSQITTYSSETAILTGNIACNKHVLLGPLLRSQQGLKGDTRINPISSLFSYFMRITYLPTSHTLQSTNS